MGVVQTLEGSFHLLDVLQQLLMRGMQVGEEMVDRRGTGMGAMEMLGCEHRNGEVAANIPEHLLLIFEW